MNDTNTPHELVLKEYISEVLQDENDLEHLDESWMRKLSWIAGSGLVFGVGCWARNTNWEKLVNDLIVLGGAEIGIVHGIHKGKPAWIVSGALIAYVWNQKPDFLRETPFVREMADMFNLLPSHEQRTVAWTLASVLVPVGAEAAIARRGAFANRRKPAEGTLDPSEPWDPEFTGVIDELSSGWRNKLGAAVGKLNTFIRDRKFAEALGYCDSAAFKDALENSVAEFNKILEAGGSGTRAATPEEIIESFKEGILQLLLKNPNDRQYKAWMRWAWVRSGPDRLRALGSRMSRLRDVTNREWQILSRHDSNRKHLKMSTVNSRFLDDIVEQDLQVFGVFDGVVLFELKSLLDTPVPVAVPRSTVPTPPSASAERVQLIDSQKWRPGEDIAFTWRPKAGSKFRVQDGAGGIDTARASIEWVEGTKYPVKMITIADAAGNPRTMLAARADDVFTAHTGMRAPEPTGDALADFAGRAIRPSSIGGASVIGARLLADMPHEPAKDEDGNDIISDVDILAYELVEEGYNAGKSTAPPPSGSCSIATTGIGGRLLGKLKNWFIGLGHNPEEESGSPHAEEDENNNEQPAPAEPEPEPEEDPNKIEWR